MTEQTKTLPPSPIQAAVEASFTLRGWSYDVVQTEGVWITSTSVRSPTGPTLLEVTVAPAAGVLSIRVDICIQPVTDATRHETGLLLSWLALWLDIATFALGPTTGKVYLRCGLSEEFGSRISAERVDRVLRHLGSRHVALAPLISRVARGQISAAEGLELLRLGR